MARHRCRRTLDGNKRVNRINYESCVLQTLRDKLGCKEIWVVGANRFRNPDDPMTTPRSALEHFAPIGRRLFAIHP